MKFFTSTLATISTLTLAQAQTTTSFDSAELASASTRALEADGTFIMTVLLDLNTRYTTAVEFMNENNMQFPSGVADYIAAMPAVSDTDELMSVILANSFPFEDFYTMMTVFPWYSTLLEEADATTFYMPEYFLTGDATAGSSVATSSTSSAEFSSITEISSSASISSFAGVTNATDSSGVSSVVSSILNTTSVSSTSSSSSSSAGGSSLYAPIMAIPLLLGAMLF